LLRRLLLLLCLLRSLRCCCLWGHGCFVCCCRCRRCRRCRCGHVLLYVVLHVLRDGSGHRVLLLLDRLLDQAGHALVERLHLLQQLLQHLYTGCRC
jgi:hypothetical protein